MLKLKAQMAILITENRYKKEEQQRKKLFLKDIISINLWQNLTSQRQGTNKSNNFYQNLENIGEMGRFVANFNLSKLAQ